MAHTAHKTLAYPSADPEKTWVQLKLCVLKSEIRWDHLRSTLSQGHWHLSQIHLVVWVIWWWPRIKPATLLKCVYIYVYIYIYEEDCRDEDNWSRLLRFRKRRWILTSLRYRKRRRFFWLSWSARERNSQPSVKSLEILIVNKKKEALVVLSGYLCSTRAQIIHVTPPPWILLVTQDFSIH